MTDEGIWFEGRTFDRLGALIFDEPKTFTFIHNHTDWGELYTDEVFFGDWKYRYQCINADDEAHLWRFALDLMGAYSRVPYIREHCTWDDDSNFFIRVKGDGRVGDCRDCKHTRECLYDKENANHSLAYAMMVLLPFCPCGEIGLKCYECPTAREIAEEFIAFDMQGIEFLPADPKEEEQ